MSRSRHPQPILADHKMFVLYRWLSWLVAGVAIVWQSAQSSSQPQAYVLLLMIAAFVNLLFTAFAQSYVRVVHKTPSLLVLDVIYCSVLLFGTGGWSGPMALHALSAIVLPALLYGWRGGLMSGLLFVSLHLAMNMVNGKQPADLIEHSGGQIDLMLTLMAAPVFGCCVPLVAEMLHRAIEQHQRSREAKPPTDQPNMNRRNEANSLSRVAPRVRTQDRQTPTLAEFSPSQTTTLRATEPQAERLRQALFLPFPDNTELATAVNLLATRFGDQTGTPARVTQLGRSRTLAYAQRMVLVRLAQEALINVQQHAHAGQIELTVRYDTQSVALLIQDNGVGLLDGTFERPGMRSLRVMQYRISELGGRLDVFETKGGGVTVLATTPLN